MSSIEVPHTIANFADRLVIYADTTKLVYLFGAVPADADPGGTDQQWDRKGGSVRRYPGDPSPYTRKAITYTVLSQKGGNRGILPGRPFTVEYEVGASTPKIKKVVQFTLVGPWTSFHAWAGTKAKVNMTIRSPGGRPYKIAASAAPPLDAQQLPALPESGPNDPDSISGVRDDAADPGAGVHGGGGRLPTA